MRNLPKYPNNRDIIKDEEKIREIFGRILKMAFV